jgi:hypothetical protein
MQQGGVMTALVVRLRWFEFLRPFPLAIAAAGLVGTADCDNSRETERSSRTEGYGYILSSGREVLPGPYEEATDFACGHALVKECSAWYVLAASGDKTPVELDNIIRVRAFSEGVAVVAVLAKDCKTEEYTVVGTDGRERMTQRFQSLDSFSGGLAPAKQDDKWGLVDPTGRWVLTNRYAAITDFSHGKALAFVEIKEEGVSARETVLVDENGRESRIPGLCGPPERGYVTASSHHRADSRDSLWTTSGELLFKAPLGRRIRCRPSEGLVFVNGGSGRKGGFFDMKGSEVFTMAADMRYAMDFNAGLAQTCSTNSLWGYIDRKGRWAIAPHFENVGDFREGLAWVEIDGKVGYVDVFGTMRINPKYERGGDFHDGIARVYH